MVRDQLMISLIKIKSFFLCLFSFIFVYICETHESFQNAIYIFDRNHWSISLKLVIKKQLKRASYRVDFFVKSVCWFWALQRIWKPSNPVLVSGQETVRYDPYPPTGNVKETATVAEHRLRARKFKGSRSDMHAKNGFEILLPELAGSHRIRSFFVIRLWPGNDCLRTHTIGNDDRTHS